jgi:hypothetical protein
MAIEFKYGKTGTHESLPEFSFDTIKRDPWLDYQELHKIPRDINKHA